jgi:hypothetical protein
VVKKRRVIVAGAGGVFGKLLVEALREEYDVVAATREVLDLSNHNMVAAFALNAYAFVCAAGPFQTLDPAIIRIVVTAGAHWLDISDDARWYFGLLHDAALHKLALQRNVCVVPGLSSLPAISCALARRLMPAHADITLFIGNDNPKGAAAIASCAMLNTPDREILDHELGIDATVRARFEMPGVRLALAALRVLPPRSRLRAAKILSRLVPRFGTQGGYVEVNGVRIAMTQRRAILPVVYALQHLDGKSGCFGPTVFDPEELLAFVAQ